MSIILHCDQCNKQMGSLEPHVIKDNKYLCKKCSDNTTTSTAPTKEASNDPTPGILGIPHDDLDYGIFIASSAISEETIITIPVITDNNSAASVSIGTEGSMKVTIDGNAMTFHSDGTITYE